MTRDQTAATAWPTAESTPAPTDGSRGFNSQLPKSNLQESLEVGSWELRASLHSALDDDGLRDSPLVEDERAAAQRRRQPCDAPEVRTQGKITRRAPDDECRAEARGQFRLRNCDRRPAEVRAIDHVYGHAAKRHGLDACSDEEVERRIERKPSERAGHAARRDEGNRGRFET